MKRLLGFLAIVTISACSQRAEVDTTPVTALQAGGNISLQRQENGDFKDPDALVWRSAQEYSIELGMAPPVHPSISLRHKGDTAVLPVYVRAATDGENYYLRLRWQDSSKNTATSRTEFADGAAIQFALGGGLQTSFMMGSPDAPVNLWYWKAGQEQVQNLAAGGFGSTTQLPTGELTMNSSYRDKGEWVVVFSRPLIQDGEYQVSLNGDAAYLSLAIWQGESKQRDGLKHVTTGWLTVN